MLPPEYLARMKGQLGSSFEAYLTAMDEEPVHSLAADRRKGICRELLPFDLSKEPVEWEPCGYYYHETELLRPGKHVLHEAGAYYIQEASAMAPARALMDGFEGDGAPYILDLCAAPGGKSVQIGTSLGNTGLLVSNEIVPARAQILSRNIERMGIANAAVTNDTPAHLADIFAGFFDGILVDAPCSGEGMFRKNPEAVSEWSPENVGMCAERQAVILECAYEMLAPGGRMVYSTCTFSGEEDEDMTAAFLEQHGDMRLLEQKKLMPHEVRGEGQYYAVMEKSGQRVPHPSFVREQTDIIKEDPRKKKKARGSAGPDNSEAVQVKDMLSELLTSPLEGVIPSGSRLRRIKDSFYLVPAGIDGRLGGLRVLRPGLHVADIKNGRAVPAHALSRVIRPEDAALAVSLSEEDAAKYIEGLSIAAENLLPAAADADSKMQGYALVTYDDIGIGWGKITGGVLKNHYPKGLRTIL